MQNKKPVFVYNPQPESPVYKALSQVVHTIFSQGVEVGYELSLENLSRYGLLIDTSEIVRGKKSDLESMLPSERLGEFDIPKIEKVNHARTAVAEIFRIVGKYYE